MELKEYQKLVQRRLDNLNEEDRQILEGLAGTPQIRAIGRVVGSELMSVIEATGKQSRKRGLAAR